MTRTWQRTKFGGRRQVEVKFATACSFFREILSRSSRYATPMESLREIVLPATGQ